MNDFSSISSHGADRWVIFGIRLGGLCTIFIVLAVCFAAVRASLPLATGLSMFSPDSPPLSALLSTVVLALILIPFSIPFGVAAAVYLRERTSPNLLSRTLRFTVRALARVPSILLGLFGLGLFCRALDVSLEDLLFTEGLAIPGGPLPGVAAALALLILPTLIVAAEESINAVPEALRRGSYACGASAWQTLSRVVLPSAAPGILAGLLPALARGVGAVTLLLLAGAIRAGMT